MRRNTSSRIAAISAPFALCTKTNSSTSYPTEFMQVKRSCALLLDAGMGVEHLANLAYHAPYLRERGFIAEHESCPQQRFLSARHVFDADLSEHAIGERHLRAFSGAHDKRAQSDLLHGNVFQEVKHRPTWRLAVKSVGRNCRLCRLWCRCRRDAGNL